MMCRQILLTSIHDFLIKQFGRTLLFIMDCLQCVINSYDLTTRQLILYRNCKGNIDINKILECMIGLNETTRIWVNQLEPELLML